MLMCVTVCTSGRRTVSTRTRHQSSAAVICHGFNLLDVKTNCPSCTGRPGRSMVIGSTHNGAKLNPKAFPESKLFYHGYLRRTPNYTLSFEFILFLHFRYDIRLFYFILNIMKRRMFFNLSCFVKFYHVSHSQNVFQYFGSFFANKGIDQKFVHKSLSSIYFGLDDMFFYEFSGHRSRSSFLKRYTYRYKFFKEYFFGPQNGYC